MSDIEAQLAALKEKAKKFDEEAPNFSMAKLLEYEKEDPMGVWSIINGPVGELLSLEDPVAFRALKLRTESHMLGETLWTLFSRLPAREARLFACDCVRHMLSLFPDIASSEDRPLRMIEIAEKYARGESKQDEFVAESLFLKGIQHHPNIVISTNPSELHWAQLLLAANALGPDGNLFDAVKRSSMANSPDDLVLCVESRRWQLSRLREKFSS